MQGNQERELVVEQYALPVEFREIIHTYPVEDLYPHDTFQGAGISCPCGPIAQIYENGNKQIIHNAWDGRE